MVITGLSGSGKSSLAFDTIYAEGQRRYVESLSAYARQFLEMMQKPDVDLIEGLSPAISIEQKTTSRNPRSTVGHRHRNLRLYAAAVRPRRRAVFARHRPADREPDRTQMVDRILELPEGTRLYLLAPVIRGRKGEYKKELADFQKRGFQRVKVDGQFYEIADAPALDKKLKHDIDVVIDRIVVRNDLGNRLADRFETALELADGLAIAEYADKPLPASESKGANKSKNETHERVIFSQRSPARSPASPSTRSSPGCSRSTTRSAPARNATASARSCSSRRMLVVPDPRCRCEGRDRALGAHRQRPRPITPRPSKRWPSTTRSR